MKILKVAGRILLGLIGLTVLLYLIGVAVNLSDQPPSAAAVEMKKVLADRAPVADADNGYVYLLGFSVPKSGDPQAVGALRKSWLEAVSRDPKQLDADPMKENIRFNATTSPSMDRMKSECGDGHSVTCRDAFRAALPQPRLGLQELQLARYRALLEKPAWREVVPTDVRVPLPAYGDIIEGQRLLFVDLAARGKSATPGEIASALRKDLAFWRMTLASSDILITKMIAVAAIRQHFHFGNLVLREVPAAQAEVIEAWSVPFSAAELSMRRTMAGELVFTEGVMLTYQRGNEGNLLEPDAEGLTLLGRIGSSLARPYYQHQDQMNYCAAFYLDIAKRFEAPLDQYARIVESIRADEQVGRNFHVYNATGHVLRTISEKSDFAGYAVRAGSVEGMRRAALLTAQLRERGVARDAIAGELSAAELRDPFDREPFEWKEDQQAVVYIGPEAERDRYWHPYFY